MPLPPSGDTIAAIATAPGEGAVGIVRVSGPEAHRIADALFHPASGARPSTLGADRVAFGRVLDEGEFIDEGLLLLFRAPRSYTGQDAVEIQVHGGPAVLRRVRDACLRLGARAAGPGEFTLRAYLNGKLDLVQAESVLSVVRAQSERARRNAAHGLTRRLSEELNGVQDLVTGAYGDLQAVMDYPEEGVALRDVGPQLQDARERIGRLLATAHAGRLLQHGARLALVGRPNAGKSSLLNALLGFERSIVSEAPGTTRDYLEAPLELEGVPVTAIDTAGIRDAEDAVERSGVRVSRQLAEHADLVLCLLDRSAPLDDDDRELMAALDPERTVLVASKGDLPAAWDEGALPRPAWLVSATRGDGLDALRARIRELLLGDAAGAEVWIGSERHAEALRHADAHLERALAGPEDLAALDLQEALQALSGVTGRGAIGEEALAHVFANFCVGK